MRSGKRAQTTIHASSNILDNTLVSDRSMDLICSLEQLDYLSLGYTKISSQSLAKLSALEELQTLALNGLLIDQTAAEALSKLDLQTLRLSQCTLTPSVLPALQNSSRLTLLDLSQTEPPKRSLLDLARRLPALQFNLTDALIDEEGLAELQSVDRLSSSNFNSPRQVATAVAQERQLLKSNNPQLINFRAAPPEKG